MGMVDEPGAPGKICHIHSPQTEVEAGEGEGGPTSWWRRNEYWNLKNFKKLHVNHLKREHLKNGQRNERSTD